MENEKHEHNSPPSAFYRHLIINTDCVLDILRFGSTALFDVGVDVDPSDNNNIVGVIRSPQPHSHLTAPSLLSPASQPSQYKVCQGKIKLFYHSAPALSLSLLLSDSEGEEVDWRTRGRQWLCHQQRLCLRGNPGDY